MTAEALREWAASLSTTDVEGMFDSALRAGDAKGG